ncbi:peptidase G1 [Mycena rosella]|uniref:Peptidase G1 n=1 Tax=Mycena rosella TaxID=1033263 RepID=A0AAD7CYR8_MYCRO|nr:peptidase G1 [Mycena rosella]
MLFSTLFVQTLVAVGVLAAPSSDKRSQSRIARREEFIRQAPGLLFHTSNWAGAVITDPTAKWKSVAGEFVVPSISTPSGLRTAFISVWVAVDGYTCKNVTFKVGVDIEIKNGVATYAAWDEYVPGEYFVENFPQLAISAGDTVNLIALAITGQKPNFPESLIENLSVPYSVGHYFNPTPPLCQSDAIWGIEVWEVGDVRLPLTVQFKNVQATRFDGTIVGPGSATVMNTVENGRALSSCSTTASTITCSFPQP